MSESFSIRIDWSSSLSRRSCNLISPIRRALRLRSPLSGIFTLIEDRSSKAVLDLRPRFLTKSLSMAITPLLPSLSRYLSPSCLRVRSRLILVARAGMASLLDLDLTDFFFDLFSFPEANGAELDFFFLFPFDANAQLFVFPISLKFIFGEKSLTSTVPPPVRIAQNGIDTEADLTSRRSRPFLLLLSLSFRFEISRFTLVPKPRSIFPILTSAAGRALSIPSVANFLISSGVITLET